MAWNDWQFWVVTAVMVIAAWRLIRVFRPGKRRPRGTKTSLTIHRTTECRD